MLAPAAIVADESKPKKDWSFGDPMRFADNWMTFDVQERLRLESRENNFDFNSAGNTLSITDDTYLLQRVRLGLRCQPNAWVNSPGFPRARS